MVSLPPSPLASCPKHELARKTPSVAGRYQSIKCLEHLGLILVYLVHHFRHTCPLSTAKHMYKMRFFMAGQCAALSAAMGPILFSRAMTRIKTAPNSHTSFS